MEETEENKRQETDELVLLTIEESYANKQHADSDDVTTHRYPQGRKAQASTQLPETTTSRDLLSKRGRATTSFAPAMPTILQTHFLAYTRRSST
ncbi:hypothetical protein CMQ_6334 [Grosmannia clavigera kw1407]|uniref:Uncharacterized protein n=1 Tax=Grosmannia clavigera (strain kw1407 / UAMH 11150) TaxID=655863 RepID=F0XMA5_GROCL|nr:uncharacterized protein CMQ_6334 [Grosmannia clavigera kw1407]EFX01392.1 hypothetical protein CMQ_6334 [Grosmannia clavigera kw1407]